MGFELTLTEPELSHDAAAAGEAGTRKSRDSSAAMWRVRMFLLDREAVKGFSAFAPVPRALGTYTHGTLGLVDAQHPASESVHTFLFADLAGYTALTEIHGDEHAAA